MDMIIHQIMYPALAPGDRFLKGTLFLDEPEVVVAGAEVVDVGVVGVGEAVPWGSGAAVAMCVRAMVKRMRDMALAMVCVKRGMLSLSWWWRA